MRIAYLASRYPAVSHTFIQREVVGLREAGLDVRTLAVRRPEEGEVLSELDRREAAGTHYLLPPGPLTLLRSHLGAFLGSPGAYLRTLRFALEQAPPGVRGHLWQVFYFGEAMLLRRFARRHTVDHVHVHFANVSADVAWLASTYAAERGEAPLTWSFTMHGPTEFYDVGEHRLAEKATAARFVACISDFARSQLMRITEPEEWDKLEIVHCGVDPSLFAPVDRPAATGTTRMLCVGRLVPAKGQRVLLGAVRRLREDGLDARVTFVGTGPDADRLEAVARAWGLEPDVAAFPGAVGQDEIREHFAAADIFCLPSFAEGVPVVLMEAMAMGLPVVTTVIAGIPELVEDGVSGVLVRPGREDLLTEALRRLAGDADERARLGAAGRARVQAEYDAAAAARVLRDVFVARVGS